VLCTADIHSKAHVAHVAHRAHRVPVVVKMRKTGMYIEAGEGTETETEKEKKRKMTLVLILFPVLWELALAFKLCFSSLQPSTARERVQSGNRISARLQLFR
jgi:hypothetical protein